jgi:serine/threonine protein kinase
MRIYELLSDEKFYFVVSEFIKYGELYEYFVKRDCGISEDEVIKITKQIFLALNYMHKNNIVHRDIKPENILIDNIDELYIKLTDFGFSTYFKPGVGMNEVLGSPIYMPPEIVA